MKTELISLILTTVLVAQLAIPIALAESPLTLNKQQGSLEKKVNIVLKIAEKAKKIAQRMIEAAEAIGIQVPENITKLLEEASNLLNEANSLKEGNPELAIELAKEAMRKFRDVIREISIIREVDLSRELKSELINATVEELTALLNRAEDRLNNILRWVESKGIELPEDVSKMIEEAFQRINDLRSRLESLAEEGNLTELRIEVHQTILLVVKLHWRLHELVRNAIHKIHGLHVAINRARANLYRFIALARRVNLTRVEEVLSDVEEKLTESEELLDSGNVTGAALTLSQAHQMMSQLVKQIRVKTGELVRKRAWKYGLMIEKFVERVSQSIDRLATRGFNITEARHYIDEAKSLIEQAKASRSLKEAIKLYLEARKLAMEATISLMKGIKHKPLHKP